MVERYMLFLSDKEPEKVGVKDYPNQKVVFVDDYVKTEKVNEKHFVYSPVIVEYEDKNGEKHELITSNIATTILNDGIKEVTFGDVGKMLSVGKDVETITGARIVDVRETDEVLLKVYKIEAKGDYSSVYPYLFFGVVHDLPISFFSPETFLAHLIGEHIGRVITEVLPGTLELEYEKKYDVFYIPTKKRYIGIKNPFDRDIKGLEIVRRDWADGAKKLQDKALWILATYEKDVAREKVRELINREIERFVRGDYDMSEVIITKSVRDLNDYVNDKLPQAVVAKLLKDAGYVVGAGSQVSYVVLRISRDAFFGKAPKTPATNLPIYKRVVPIEMINNVEEVKKYIDIDYVLEHLILPPTLRVAESLGIKVKAITKRDKRTLTLDLYTKVKIPNKKKATID